MAIAKKCDRCGCYYDRYGEKKKAKKINEKLKSANKKIRFLIFLCYTTNVVKYQ